MERKGVDSHAMRRLRLFFSFESDGTNESNAFDINANSICFAIWANEMSMISTVRFFVPFWQSVLAKTCHLGKKNQVDIKQHTKKLDIIGQSDWHVLCYAIYQIGALGCACYLTTEKKPYRLLLARRARIEV